MFTEIVRLVLGDCYVELSSVLMTSEEEDFLPPDKIKMNAICSIAHRLMKAFDEYLHGKSKFLSFFLIQSM